MTVLCFVLQGVLHGHCDLDVLLHPFFMHLSSQVEIRPLYPGLGDPRKNIPNRILALARLDSAKRWRNQYQSRGEDCSGLSIARLSGTLFPK